MESFFVILLAHMIILSSAFGGGKDIVSAKFTAEYKDFRIIRDSANIIVELRYASSNNFTGKNLYGKYNHAWVHKLTYKKLFLAATLLQKRYPGFKIKILDATRSRRVQQILWDHVKGSSKQKYVANPAKGSIHNYGFALDLTLVNSKGVELDMGTQFDDFSKLAQPRLEKKYLASGKLSPQQYANRLLLRSIMSKAKFIQLPIEWWHFDALPYAKVKQNYSIVE